MDSLLGQEGADPVFPWCLLHVYFLLAKVQFPILGIDFLRHYHLVVDAAGGQLVDARCMRAFPAASPIS